MALDGERGKQEEEKKKKKKKKKRKKKEQGAQKSGSLFAATMGENDPALRAGGRGLSDPWADSAGAWEIPWTEEPGRLQSMGSQRVGLD